MASAGRYLEIAATRARIRRRLNAVVSGVRDEVESGMVTDGAIVASAMRRIVSVEHGTLRDSIKIAPLDPPKIGVMIFAGGPKAFYARWVEFGTRFMRARPFFWPTWRSFKKVMKRRTGQRISNVIKKAMKVQ